MDDAAVVGVFQGRGELTSDLQHLAPGQSALPFEHGVEAGAGDVLHGEPGPAVVDAGIEEADDVGVVEMADNFDLTLEAQHEARLGGQFGGQHLDGDDGRPVGDAGSAWAR